MIEKIEVRVKSKNNNLKFIEYKGVNKIYYRHYLEKGNNKIYVYPENLELAKEELTKNKLEFAIIKD